MKRTWPIGQICDTWHAVFREGPTALLDTLLDHIEPEMSEPTRTILKRWVEGWRDQVRWIDQARQDLVGEAARIRELGEAMRRAGLRSYTDKEGRIYVAPDR